MEMENKFKEKKPLEDKKMTSFEQLKLESANLQNKIKIAEESFNTEQKNFNEKIGKMSEEESQIEFGKLKKSSEKLLELFEQDYSIKSEMSKELLKNINKPVYDKAISEQTRIIEMMESDIQRSIDELNEKFDIVDKNLELSDEEIQALSEYLNDRLKQIEETEMAESEDNNFKL